MLARVQRRSSSSNKRHTYGNTRSRDRRRGGSGERQRTTFRSSASNILASPRRAEGKYNLKSKRHVYCNFESVGKEKNIRIAIYILYIYISICIYIECIHCITSQCYPLCNTGMGITGVKSNNQYTGLPRAPLPRTGASSSARRDEGPAASASASTPKAATTSKKPRKPKSMTRATAWSPEVENMYRLQQSGWSTLEHYEVVHDPPTRWFVIPLPAVALIFSR